MPRSLIICAGITLNLIILAIPLLLHKDAALSSPLIAFFFLMSVFCGAEMLAGTPDNTSSSDAGGWSYLPHMSGMALLMLLWVSAWNGANVSTNFGLIKTISALVILASVWVRYVAITTLKENFLSHVNLSPNHMLIRTGIYSRLRHPSELGLLLIGLNVPILLGSTVGVVVFGLTLFPLIIIRIIVEDDMLSASFPTEFARYKSKTPALFPRVALNPTQISSRKDTA